MDHVTLLMQVNVGVGDIEVRLLMEAKLLQ
jgi:hypothetical protein